MSKLAPLHVAVGIIKNDEGKILIAYRHESMHQGGLWEFPGGKLEIGETAEQALVRELWEELHITVERALPTITIEHQYHQVTVLLHVWTVEKFSGVAEAAEGQPIQWVKPEALSDYNFPAANRPIIAAARLSEFYAIVGAGDIETIRSRLQTLMGNGIKLIQLRVKSLPGYELARLLDFANPLCKSYGASLLLNSAMAIGNGFGDLGRHLTSRHLMALNKRPDDVELLAASCHTLEELQHAQTIGVDFIVLAPVLATASHPGVKTLGWEKFNELVATVNIPVYALGGMRREYVVKAREQGAQGIAGISAFLP